MKIVMTKKFRKNLVLILNLIKVVTLAVGGFITVMNALALDSIGIYGEWAAKGAFVGLAIMYTSMLIEVITVKFFVKDGEHISTIFCFNFYGLKSRSAYLEYKDELRQSRLEESLLEENDNMFDNVISLNDRKIV